jgi:hypothetical protein
MLCRVSEVLAIQKGDDAPPIEDDHHQHRNPIRLHWIWPSFYPLVVSRHNPYQTCSTMAFATLWKWLLPTQLNIGIQAFSDVVRSRPMWKGGDDGQDLVSWPGRALIGDLRQCRHH